MQIIRHSQVSEEAQEERQIANRDCEKCPECGCDKIVSLVEWCFNDYQPKDVVTRTVSDTDRGLQVDDYWCHRCGCMYSSELYSGSGIRHHHKIKSENEEYAGLKGALLIFAIGFCVAIVICICAIAMMAAVMKGDLI